MTALVARQIVPHNPDTNYHQWVYLPGWRDVPATITRDALGRQHRNAWRDWLVLICNNQDCPGQAIVSAEVVCDIAATTIHDEAHR